MDWSAILTRAALTAVQSTLGMLLASGLTGLDADAAQAAAVTGTAAGLSVLYNALTQYLDRSGAKP